MNKSIHKKEKRWKDELEMDLILVRKKHNLVSTLKVRKYIYFLRRQ